MSLCLLFFLLVALDPGRLNADVSVRSRTRNGDVGTLDIEKGNKTRTRGNQPTGLSDAVSRPEISAHTSHGSIGSFVGSLKSYVKLT